jgi:chromosome partitioning protein
MHVISVLKQKGGSGATTIAKSLAVAAHAAGLSVAIVDLDPQASACNWSDRRQPKNPDQPRIPPTVISIQPGRLEQTLKTARENGADLVIIDAPPRLADAAMAAAKKADLILIPARCTVEDLETIPSMQSLITGAGATAKVMVVLNAVPAQGAQRRQAEDTIRNYGLPVCPAAFGQRADYTHASILGQTAQEYNPRGQAAQEIEQLYKFTRKLLNTLTQKQDHTHGKEKSRSVAGA